MVYRFIFLLLLFSSYVSPSYAMDSPGCFSLSGIIPYLRGCFFSEGFSTELQSSHIESCEGRAPLWEQVWWGKMTGPIQLLNTAFQGGCLSVAYSNGTIQRCFFSYRTIDSFVDYSIVEGHYSYKQNRLGCLFCSLQGSIFCYKDSLEKKYFSFDGMGHVFSDNKIIIANSSGLSFFNTRELANKGTEGVASSPIRINAQSILCYAALQHVIIAGDEKGILLYDQKNSSWSMLNTQSHYCMLLKASIGNCFAAVTKDGRVALWSYNGVWYQLGIFDVSVPIDAAALVDEHYLIVGHNKMFHIYSFEQSDMCAAYSFHMEGKVLDITLSEDAQCLAVATSCNKVTLWRRADFCMVPYRS